MKKYTLIILIIFPIITKAQLINGDFENIDTITLTNNTTYQKPANWSYGWEGNYGTEITTDSYSGNYALKLWSWYYMQSNEELHYGDYSTNGVSLSNRPVSLKGYYKFTNPNIQPNKNPDSVYVRILLTKHNSTLNVRDTISYTEKNLREQNSYTSFEIELNYLSTQNPDTIQVYFRTSYFQGPSDNTNECNYLYLDNLSLNYSPLGIEGIQEELYNLFPNPVSNNLEINSNTAIKIIELYSIEGKLIKYFEFNSFQYQIKLNLDFLEKGLFFINAIDRNNEFIFIKKIIKK